MVWHDRLLYKLKKFLHQVFFQIIKSNLSDRYFNTCIGDTFSSITKVSAGVPQGGILSPLFYNIFASDHPTTPHTQVADYADDKVIISLSPDPILASSWYLHHLCTLVHKMEVKNKSIRILTYYVHSQALTLPCCLHLWFSNSQLTNGQISRSNSRSQVNLGSTYKI